MKITAIFDKKTVFSGLRTGWGVSFIIGEEVIFDTGENGAWLLANIKHICIPVGRLKKIVISHDHWDHKGGMRALLDSCPRTVVYGCPDFGSRFKASVRLRGHRLVETTNFLKISENIFTTGQIAGYYKGKFIPEQALVIKGPGGLSMITGCAHPGILKMIEHTKRYFREDVSLVAGGFHLHGKHDKTAREIAGGFKSLGVRRVAPAHCTGESAERVFKEEYGDDFVNMGAGKTIEV